MQPACAIADEVIEAVLESSAEAQIREPKSSKTL
jgi:hypothetical protein